MTFISDTSPGAPSAVVSSTGIADSLEASGTVVAPGAGAALCTLAAPPAGVYEVRISAAVGTGKAAADDGNVQFKKGAAVNITSVPTTGNELTIDRVTLDGATALSLAANGAGTAGVPYTARITATRVA